ncbi:MAG TPA: hypothetical protein VGL70_01225 [Candidatus Binatia bacterium]|jgi:hypothetical protein
MNAEFFYKGPLGAMGFRYRGREWAFLATVIILALVILGVMIVKSLAGF